jgi:5-hydroxyisourate hydrolase
MSAITTHILDTSRGRPAAGVEVTLELQSGASWKKLGAGTTDGDGRLRTLLPEKAPIDPGLYRLTFDTAAYFARTSTEGFYPSVEIRFVVRAAGEHYHVPLLLSPYGYSTYRGS